MVAQRKIEHEQHAAAPVSVPAWEEMVDPLHPMHQELLRRFEATSASADSGLSVPQRFATVFYLGLASWGAVGVGALLVRAIL